MRIFVAGGAVVIGRRELAGRVPRGVRLRAAAAGYPGKREGSVAR